MKEISAVLVKGPRKDYIPYINKPNIATSLDGLYKTPAHVKDGVNIVKFVPSSARRVLDAGCGTGRLTPHFQELSESKIEGVYYLGVDLADKLLDKAKKNYPEADLRVMDVRSLKLASGSFDAVLCINVLKHLHRHEVGFAFSELVRVSAKGATIIIRVPIIPETRSYDVYDKYLLDKIAYYEDIAFHWSDIFRLADAHNLVITHPESFLTSKAPYTAPIIVFKKS